MRKREIIHLHILGGLIQNELADRGALAPDALHAYRDRSVFPAEIYAEKTAHRDAVFDLYDGLSTSVTEESPAVPAETV